MSIKSSIIALGLFLVGSISSCSSSGKSLSDLKDEQTEAIDRFRASQNLRVVSLSGNELPSPIDPNVYYHLRNGLYMRVLDAGSTTDRAKQDQTVVYLQMRGYQFSRDVSQTNVFDNLSKASSPELEFRYTYYYNAGDVHYITMGNSRPLSSYDVLMCEGLAFPVSVLGNGARVSLIIPFELGPSTTYGSGISTYVAEAHYTFKH